MTPDEFSDVFAHGWALPKPDAFLAYFLPLIADDAVFIQPGLPEAKGHARIARLFRRLFALYPDLSTTPVSSAWSGDTFFVNSVCATRIGRRSIQFDVCDRFVIRDGKIVVRQSYCDPTPTLAALALSPAGWKRILDFMSVRSTDPTDRSR